MPDIILTWQNFSDVLPFTLGVCGSVYLRGGISGVKVRFVQSTRLAFSRENAPVEIERPKLKKKCTNFKCWYTELSRRRARQLLVDRVGDREIGEAGSGW